MYVGIGYEGLENAANYCILNTKSVTYLKTMIQEINSFA